MTASACCRRIGRRCTTRRPPPVSPAVAIRRCTRSARSTTTATRATRPSCGSSSSTRCTRRGPPSWSSGARSVEAVFTFGPADVGEDLGALLDEVSPASLRWGTRLPEDLTWLLYTGGTTGVPKAAMLPERAVAQMVQSVSIGWDLPDERRYLACAPISHAAGMLVTPVLLAGGTVVLMRSFDPGEWLRLAAAQRITLGTAGADDDLRRPRPPGPRRRRPVGARDDHVRRLADVADPAGRGHRADRAGVRPALRADRVRRHRDVDESRRPPPEDPRAPDGLRVPDAGRACRHPRRRRQRVPGRRSRARSACRARR